MIGTVKPSYCQSLFSSRNGICDYKCLGDKRGGKVIEDIILKVFNVLELFQWELKKLRCCNLLQSNWSISCIMTFLSMVKLTVVKYWYMYIKLKCHRIGPLQSVMYSVISKMYTEKCLSQACINFKYTYSLQF